MKGKQKDDSATGPEETKSRVVDGRNEEIGIKADADPRLYDGPLVVELTDGRSGSPPAQRGGISG